MEQHFIILNPWAGRGIAVQHRGILEQALRDNQIDYTLTATKARGDATQMAQHAVEQGYQRIVVAGGDGTINEVVNGVRNVESANGSRTQLGIIPFGTGNDFIKSLNGFAINDVPGAVRRLSDGQSHPVDLGGVRADGGPWRYFINGLGMGFDAQVAFEAMNITRLRGLAVYIVAIVRALAKYKAHPMSIVYNQSQIQQRLLFASVGNGKCQGGGFWITPDALMDDGLLDVCLVNNLRLDEIIRHVPKLMRGTHTTNKHVTMGRAPQIQVRSDAPIPVATDGEVITTNARNVTVETFVHVLEVIV
ncbi:MAG: diacylglycerol kinase family protein [Chloroflexota bacterium]